MATVSLGGSLVEKIEAIARAGFDGIELFDADLRNAQMSPAECAQRCADVGLSIELYQPFRRAEGVHPDEFPAVTARFRGELEIAHALGTKAILIVSNTDDDADPSRDLSVAQLRALADIAADYEKTIMFEALCWGTHINKAAEAWEVVRLTEHPNVEFVLDTFHLIAGGEDSDSFPYFTDNSVGFVQLADAPWLSLDLIDWSRGHRCFPGEGQFDLQSPVQAALASGYQGALSLEIFNPTYRERPARDVSQQGAESLRRFIDQLPSLSSSRPEGAQHLR